MKTNCKHCANLSYDTFKISMAFQPILDVVDKKVVSYEALVRGLNNESAFSVFSKVNKENMYEFDQICRVTAIKKAVELGVDVNLNINFMPNAVYQPETCIRKTLEASKKYGFPHNKINFEITESEEILDIPHLYKIIEHYKKLGFVTMLDDFGSGFANLNLLAKLDLDCYKIDMTLLRDIHIHIKQQHVIKCIIDLANILNVDLIAEGVECKEEFELLRTLGIRYFQGYYFAKPLFEGLPEINWSEI